MIGICRHLSVMWRRRLGSPLVHRADLWVRSIEYSEAYFGTAVGRNSEVPEGGTGHLVEGECISSCADWGSEEGWGLVPRVRWGDTSGIWDSFGGYWLNASELKTYKFSGLTFGSSDSSNMGPGIRIFTGLPKCCCCVWDLLPYLILIVPSNMSFPVDNTSSFVLNVAHLVPSLSLLASLLSSPLSQQGCILREMPLLPPLSAPDVNVQDRWYSVVLKVLLPRAVW